MPLSFENQRFQQIQDVQTTINLILGKVQFLKDIDIL